MYDWWRWVHTPILVEDLVKAGFNIAAGRWSIMSA